MVERIEIELGLGGRRRNHDEAFVLECSGRAPRVRGGGHDEHPSITAFSEERGNRHGLVGRFFANHPSAYVGTLHLMPHTRGAMDAGHHAAGTTLPFLEIGRASCRERV